MVIYEVTLHVENKIVPSFKIWLTAHIQEMLKIEGFLSAETFQAEADEANKQMLVVLYRLSSRKDLQNYLDKHSARMRGDGLSKFGGQFTATRRILNSI